MRITFTNDSDVIVYVLKQITSFARDNQYILVANCVWWLAGIIRLDEELKINIDNLVSRKAVSNWEVSTVPQDIWRTHCIQSQNSQQCCLSINKSEYISDRLKRTRKGWVNRTPQTKKQLKQARKRKAKETLQLKLAYIRKDIIKDLRENTIWSWTTTYTHYLSILVTIT